MDNEGWEWAVKALQEQTHYRAEVERIRKSVIQIQIYRPDGNRAFYGYVDAKEEHAVQFLIMGFLDAWLEINQ